MNMKYEHLDLPPLPCCNTDFIIGGGATNPSGSLTYELGERWYQDDINVPFALLNGIAPKTCLLLQLYQHAFKTAHRIIGQHFQSQFSHALSKNNYKYSYIHTYER